MVGDQAIKATPSNQAATFTQNHRGWIRSALQHKDLQGNAKETLVNFVTLPSSQKIGWAGLEYAWLKSQLRFFDHFKVQIFKLLQQ